MYLPYLSVHNTLEGCSNLLTKVSLDINSFKDIVLEEINSEVELKEFMTTVGFLEEKEIFLEFELKLESARLSAFSSKPGLEIEAELEFCTILTNFSGLFILQLSYLPVEIMFEASSKLLTEI